VSNIPYIKKELRPIFDFAVYMARKKNGHSIKSVAECVEFGVKDMPPEVMDGCLNYAFTQLLRKVDDLKFTQKIIHGVIKHLFWDKPKYFRYERVEGLLNCMIKEYRRRAWRRQRKVVKVLKELLYLHDQEMSYYEIQKECQNGDLK
jgi:hypothetical protein